MLSLVMRRWLCLVAALVLCVPLAVLSAQRADATLPGRNGLIAFAATKSGQGIDIYTMRPDGTSLHRLTRSGNARDPAWEPHGDHILYTNGNAVWIMDAAGRHQTRVVRQASDPAWSPDGLQFAFVSDRSGMTELWIYTFASHLAVQFTPDGSSTGPWAWAPSWSPDGSRVAFISARWGSWNPYCPEYNLWTLQTDGSGANVVYAGDGMPSSAASWSPGGHRIVWAYTSLIGEGCDPAGSGLIVQTLSGSAKHTIPTGGDTNPVWSPDGRWIASARPIIGRTAQPGLWVRRIDGTGAHRIVVGSKSLDIHDVDWQSVPG